MDPIDVARALNGLKQETTLVVVVSKTFTTAETMLNARTVRCSPSLHACLQHLKLVPLAQGETPYVKAVGPIPGDQIWQYARIDDSAI